MLRILLILTCLLTPISLAAQGITVDAQMARAATILDDVDQLKALKDKGVNLTKVRIEGRYLLSFAAGFGNEQATAYLVTLGADINAVDDDGYTAVMRALESGYTEIAQQLDRAGADLGTIANDGHSVRTLAEQAGLDDFGPEPTEAPTLDLTTEEANQIALAAAEAGDLTAYVFAMENGADKKAKAANGWSALMMAALGGQVELVEYMIKNQHGPSFGRANPYAVADITAVHAALVYTKSKSGDDVVKILSLLRKTHPFSRKFSDTKFATIVSKSSFDPTTKARLGQIFPQPPLPPLDYALPVGVPQTDAGWKSVQRVLADQGLYTGAIDGKAGPNTYRALLAYIEPLAYDILERAKLAADRSVRLEDTRQKSGTGYTFNGYVQPSNTYWSAGEYDFTSRKRTGYSMTLSGDLQAGKMVGNRSFRSNYKRGALKAYVSFSRSVTNARDAFAPANMSMGLFDDQVFITFDKDRVSICALKFTTCTDVAIKRDLSRYDIAPKLYQDFKKRTELAEAGRKARERAEKETAKKRQKELDAKILAEKLEKSEELLPLRRNDRRITGQEFNQYFPSKMLTFTDGFKIWYGTTGDYQTWSRKGKKSAVNRRYKLSAKDNVCMNSGLETQYCHYWVVNGQSVLIVTKSRRYLLERSWSDLTGVKITDSVTKPETTVQTLPKTSETVGSVTFPPRSDFKLRAGDEDLSDEQLLRHVIGKRLSPLHDGLNLTFGEDGTFKIWEKSRNILSAPYIVKDGVFAFKTASEKPLFRRFVFSSGSLVMVSKTNRTFMRQD